MKIRNLVSALAIGSLAFFGIAAGPGNAPGDLPEQAEEGCKGLNEATGRDGGNGQAGESEAKEILEEVKDLLADDKCEGDNRGSASGDNGRPNG
jgi:hypothetical protein